jgi:hypothetical protein
VKTVAPLSPIEPLERRTLLAITAQAGGLLEVTGTDGSDDFVVRISPDNVDHIQVFDGVEIKTFVRSTVRSVSFQGFAGDDEFFVDNRFGFVSKTGSGLTITIDGGEGSDRLALTGDAGGTSIASGIAVGATPDSGIVVTRNHKSSQHVSYAGIEQVFDLTTATELTVSGNGGANVIEIVNGPAVNGAATGQVRIFNATACDDGSHGEHPDGDRIIQSTFAPIVFANKQALVVRGNGGHDLLDLDLAAQPAGLQSVIVDGGRGKDQLAAQQARGVGYVSYRAVERRERQRSFTLLSTCPSVATVSDDDADNDDDDDDRNTGGRHDDAGNGNGSGNGSSNHGGNGGHDNGSNSGHDDDDDDRGRGSGGSAGSGSGSGGSNGSSS